MVRDCSARARVTAWRIHQTRIGCKPETQPVVKFIHCFYKSDISLLNQIQKLKPPAAIVFGYGNDQPEICLNEALFGYGNARLLVTKAYHQSPYFRGGHSHFSFYKAECSLLRPSSSFLFNLLEVFIDLSMAANDPFNLNTVKLKSTQG